MWHIVACPNILELNIDVYPDCELGPIVALREVCPLLQKVHIFCREVVDEIDIICPHGCDLIMRMDGCWLQEGEPSFSQNTRKALKFLRLITVEFTEDILRWSVPELPMGCILEIDLEKCNYQAIHLTLLNLHRARGTTINILASEHTQVSPTPEFALCKYDVQLSISQRLKPQALCPCICQICQRYGH